MMKKVYAMRFNNLKNVANPMSIEEIIDNFINKAVGYINIYGIREVYENDKDISFNEKINEWNIKLPECISKIISYKNLEKWHDKFSKWINYNTKNIVFQRDIEWEEFLAKAKEQFPSSDTGYRLNIDTGKLERSDNPVKSDYEKIEALHLDKVKCNPNSNLLHVRFNIIRLVNDEYYFFDVYEED